MNKNIYSLVLRDDIISEIDRLSAENGTSRSNMINQILADYLSFSSPEKEMREVFSHIEAQMLQNELREFEALIQPADSMYSLRSSIPYKYNPTVKYSIEIKENCAYFGEIRVSFRSQSNMFRLYMLQFFKLWDKMETGFKNYSDTIISDERYIKRIYLRSSVLNNKQIGIGISEYIKTMNKCMQLFFINIDQPAKAISEIETVYRNYLRKEPSIY